MTDRETAAQVAVFGAGAWGTALAAVSAEAGHRVALVGRDEEAVAQMRSTGESPRLPGVPLSRSVVATTDPAAVAAADLVILAAPAQATRAAMGVLGPHLKPGTALVVAAKGIDRTTGLLVSELVDSIWSSGPIAVLSGPGFAGEIARGLPTAVTIASEDLIVAEAVCRMMATRGFRPYASADVVGVQLGGALKNVLAIAAGVVAGRALGASAEAAVITRGFVEMRRLAAVWGAKPETMMGLSGLGDLVLTCRSTQSRNFSFGVAIGRGDDPSAFGPLAEGAHTASIAVERAHAFGLDLPIMTAVADVLARALTVDEAVERLLARPLKREDAI